MKLQDRLPKGVTVGKRFYKCDFDFRNVLDMLDTLTREDLLPGARAYQAMKCVMKRPPKDCTELVAAVRELLFSGGKKHADKKKVTDFVQDADLIRAAFLQSYGINLYRDKLHWLEFSCLLAGLPEGSRYQEIIGIRVRPMPKATKYNKEEREWLTKAKAAYALELTDEEKQKNLDQCIVDIFHGLLAWANGVNNNG